MAFWQFVFFDDFLLLLVHFGALIFICSPGGHATYHKSVSYKNSNVKSLFNLPGDILSFSFVNHDDEYTKIEM